MAFSRRLVPQLFWGCGEEDGSGFPVATTLSFSPVNKALLLSKVFPAAMRANWVSGVSDQGTKALHDLQRQLFH